MQNLAPDTRNRHMVVFPVPRFSLGQHRHAKERPFRDRLGRARHLDKRICVVTEYLRLLLRRENLPDRLGNLALKLQNRQLRELVTLDEELLVLRRISRWERDIHNLDDAVLVRPVLDAV